MRITFALLAAVFVAACSSSPAGEPAAADAAPAVKCSGDPAGSFAFGYGDMPRRASDPGTCTAATVEHFVTLTDVTVERHAVDAGAPFEARATYGTFGDAPCEVRNGGTCPLRIFCNAADAIDLYVDGSAVRAELTRTAGGCTANFDLVGARR